MFPGRRGGKPWTGPYVTHVQLTQNGPVELTGALFEWIRGEFPAVHEGPGEMSDPDAARAFLRRMFPGAEIPDDLQGERARGFFVDRDAPAGVLLLPVSGRREFVHVHDDGSLHVALPPRLRAEMLAAGWGEPHPYFGESVNVTMVFAPRTAQELEVIKDIVRAAYDYATGAHPDRCSVAGAVRVAGAPPAAR